VSYDRALLMQASLSEKVYRTFRRQMTGVRNQGTNNGCIYGLVEMMGLTTQNATYDVSLGDREGRGHQDSARVTL
jgi:hypothetical protein